MSSFQKGDKANIVGIDIGSTTISCYIFDEKCKVKGQAKEIILLEHPKPGYTEIDPDSLWDQFLDVTKQAFQSSSITAKDVTAFGISTQRGTFITWDRNTGKPLHKFIGWQDLRAAQISDGWNSSWTLSTINKVSKLLYNLTGNNRYKAASVINFKPTHASMRLSWLFKNDPVAYEKASNGTLMFGAIDTWLIWRLSGGKVHVTDYSNASSTGIFDPYQSEWSSFFCSLLSFPMSIFPALIDTAGFIIDVEESIFGASFPVTGLAADQQASVFGQCCFAEGDINCTLGTGTFIDINTGPKPHASVGGLYPLVGWKIGDELTFIAEGQICGTSPCIEWCENIGLFQNVMETSDMAVSAESTDGVFFVPAFDGLQVPYNDHNAVSLLIGVKKNTSKEKIMRAVLESIAFRFYQLYQIVFEEIRVPVTSSIKADGGVTNNDFVMQLISTLTKHDIERSSFADMSAVGAAYFAGLGAGIWQCKEDLREFRNSQSTFLPKEDIKKNYDSIFNMWKKAVRRSLNWYQSF